MQIIVCDNNVDQAPRARTKELQREGACSEMKLRPHYENPSEQRARDQAATIGRPQDRAEMRGTGSMSET